MCTRYVLLQEHLREILKRLGLEAEPGFVSRYNIAPGSLIPAVRTHLQTAQPEAVALRWGFVPSWAKSAEGSAQLVNARAETVAIKPSFRDALRHRRCVIPASGFYEWEHRGRARQPWLFRRRDERPFGFAGLWEGWRAADGAMLETCALITTGPNALMRPIHDRMPVLLAPEQFASWLDPRVTQPDELAPLLCAAPAETMSAIAVSPHVSNVRHEGPACLAPAEAEDDSPQISLGFS
jgi:putative SOS response-associated peptidase YedK